AAPVGVAIYARLTNTNPLQWVSVRFLLDRAEHDSERNGRPHRLELLRRAMADEVRGKQATMTLERILDWQRRESVDWAGLGDIFAYLAMNGRASRAQVHQFW